MDLFLSSLAILGRWDVIAALLVGSVGGVVIGAIPGVGAAVAIAILLPATFSLDPIVGLTALLGIYGSSMYGGAIPAVLINTPGTAVNALTTYDGHPMTKRGEARRALSLAYSASFFGGVFSVICLILLAPVLAAVAPMFGSREIFLAAAGASRADGGGGNAGLVRDIPQHHRARVDPLHPTLYVRAILAILWRQPDRRGARPVRAFPGLRPADRPG
jgi:TctA family transporter